MKEQLKNPVWSALSETHQHFAMDYNGVKFYKPEICNFGAFVGDIRIEERLNSYANVSDDFYIVGDRPAFDNSLKLKREVPCFQMVLKSFREYSYTDKIVKLTKENIDEVYELIWLTMPGYYQKKGFTMGNYYGVFKENTLVALAGERLQSDFFIEISAVVTRPGYRGKGYAKQLVAYASQRVKGQGKVPVLHVAQSNRNAIRLYEGLGFEFLQEIVWRNFTVNK